MLIRLVAVTLLVIPAANRTLCADGPLSHEESGGAADAASTSDSSQKPQSRGEPESRPRQWRFNVTPRIAIRQSAGATTATTPDASNFQRVTVELSASTEAGATFAVSPPGWSRTELVLTVLSIPSSTGSFETLVLSPLPFIAVGTVESSRLDVEASMLRRIGQTRAHWIAGIEYIRLATDRRGPSIFQLLDSHSRRANYLAKAGVGGSFDLSPSGRHQIFTDALVTVGFRTESSSFVNLALDQHNTGAALGFDVSSGYRFLLTKGIAIGARYRIQALTGAAGVVAGTAANSDLLLLHGLEFHASIPF
jgi:hypothetical protein